MSEARPSANTIAAPPEPLPSRFGRYEIRGVLGEGSMGRIYEAFDPLGNRRVAIKALRPDSFSSESAEDYLKRFRREAQAAGRLNHPSIVTIFDVGEDYFVMELLQGETLQTILKAKERLGFGEALVILEPVAAALDYAHENSTIHRDVKPANIMVLPDGRVKLTDFGIAHLASTVMTASGMFLGSPCYMAPEQVTNSEASPRADLFSFAVVAYETLTGGKPFSGDAITSIVFQVVHVDPPPPTARDNTLPPWVDDVFKRALSKDPAARFESAADFIRALRGESLGEGSGPVRTGLSSAWNGSGRFLRRVLPWADPEETHDLKDAAGLDGAPPRARWKWPALAVAAALVLAGGGYYAARNFGAGAPTTGVPDAAPTVMPARASLRVETVPEGARVIVDGTPRGVAPLDLFDLPPRPHTIKLALAGHAPTEVTFEPVESMPPLLFRLQPLPRPTPRQSAGPATPAPTPLPVVVAAAPSVEPVPAPPSPDPDQIFEKASPGVTPPRLISRESVSYPSEADRLKLQGTVLVEMIIDREGRIADIKILESAGEILDRAALEGISKWRYEPATWNGTKVRFRHFFRQTFWRGPRPAR